MDDLDRYDNFYKSKFKYSLIAVAIIAVLIVILKILESVFGLVIFP